MPVCLLNMALWALGKAHMHSLHPVRLKSPKGCPWHSPVFVWMNTDHSRPRSVCYAGPFHGAVRLLDWCWSDLGNIVPPDQVTVSWSRVCLLLLTAFRHCQANTGPFPPGQCCLPGICSACNFVFASNLVFACNLVFASYLVFVCLYPCLFL